MINRWMTFTLRDGKPITVNLEQVKCFSPDTAGGTCIEFDEEMGIYVKQTYEEVLMMVRNLP